MRTLECIGNPVGGNQIGNAVWKGFYLEELLKQVGGQGNAIRAQFAAADGYWTSVDLEWITQPGVLLVYEMNGQPLPHEIVKVECGRPVAKTPATWPVPTAPWR